jgi:hypothetical protein
VGQHNGGWGVAFGLLGGGSAVWPHRSRGGPAGWRLPPPVPRHLLQKQPRATIQTQHEWLAASCFMLSHANVGKSRDEQAKRRCSMRPTAR